MNYDILILKHANIIHKKHALRVSSYFFWGTFSNSLLLRSSNWTNASEKEAYSIVEVNKNI